MVGRIVADVAAPCTARVAAFEVVSSLRRRPAGVLRLSLRPAAPTRQVND